MKHETSILRNIILYKFRVTQNYIFWKFLYEIFSSHITSSKVSFGTNVEMYSHTVAMTQRPVSDSPRFYHFCVEQFMSLSFILPKSHSSAFYFYLITLPRQDRMPWNSRRKQMSKNEAEKMRSAWTALNRNGRVRNC